MTDILVREQKNIIQKYDELNRKEKNPVFANYNGRLIIYKKDCDSFIEKIQ